MIRRNPTAAETDDKIPPRSPTPRIGAQPSVQYNVPCPYTAEKARFHAVVNGSWGVFGQFADIAR